jgi:hypothetical protein
MLENKYTISENKISTLYGNVDNAYMDMRVALTSYVCKFPKADRGAIYDILLKGNFATANAAINTFKKKEK